LLLEARRLDIPLFVQAGKTHSPPAALEILISRITFALGVIGIRRRALSALPYGILITEVS